MQKNQYQLVKFLLIIVSGISCINANENTAESVETASYRSLVADLFIIECEHLKMEGITPEDSGIYAFRAAAFHAVLKDLDRTVLVRYEDIYQELSRLEHAMSEMERKEYDAYLAEVYSKPCR